MPKITKRIVDALKPDPKGEVYIWDNELRGFGVRMRSSGVGAFLIKYRNQERRTRKLVLGRVGTLTPDEARGLARDMLANVAKGRDPAEERLTRRNAMTVRELCDRYWAAAEAGLSLGKKGGPKKTSNLSKDRSRVQRHILPLLGTRKVAELTQADLTRFMRDVTSGKTALVEKTGKLRGKAIVEGARGAAARTVGLLSGILSFAVSEGIIPTNPARGIKRPADQKLSMRLTPESYRALGRAIEMTSHEHGSLVPIRAVWLLALTGCRKSEILNLRWAEVDEVGCALRLSDSKEGASVRPLGRPALALLQQVGFGAPAAYVLTGSDGNRPYGGLPGAWTRLAKAAGLEGVTLHTLRHSFASTAADLGYSEPTIAAMLGHSSGTVTGRYIHHLGAVLIEAAHQVAQHIQACMTGDAAGVPEVAMDRNGEQYDVVRGKRGVGSHGWTAWPSVIPE